MPVLRYCDSYLSHCLSDKTIAIIFEFAEVFLRFTSSLNKGTNRA